MIATALQNSCVALMEVMHFFISLQAMSKRVSKAERTNQLVIYCVEQDRTSIANASFLLAAFLLVVVGKTAAQAAERFTGSCAPYFLVPFRDASFCRQVARNKSGFLLRSHSSRPTHARPHTILLSSRGDDLR